MSVTVRPTKVYVDTKQRDVSASFQSRAAAQAAEVPAWVDQLFVLHDGEVRDYVRSSNCTALQTADGQKWKPAGNLTVGHWGAVADSTVLTDGTVTGTDCTAQAQAMIDWLVAELAVAATVSGTRVSPPKIKWGRGQYRLSGSLNWTKISTNGRNIEIDMFGSVINMDCAGLIGFDFTDAEYFILSGFCYWGSFKTGLTPAFALRCGRIQNNNTAAHWVIRHARGAHGVSRPNSFLYAAFWQMASEVSFEQSNNWVNYRTNATNGYAAIYDSINDFAYETPQTVSSIVSGVFTVAGHGYANGDKVVFTDRAFTTIKSRTLNSPIDGQVWTVGNVTTDTFTISNATSGTFTGGPLPDTDMTLVGQVGTRPVQYSVCREKITPSQFFGDTRAEPYKRHSGQINDRDSCTYWCDLGRAAIRQGSSEGLRFRNAFASGPTGVHLVSVKNNSANSLQSHGGFFQIHVEKGVLTAVQPVSWADLEAVYPGEYTESFFGNTVFQDNGTQAESGFRLIGSTTAVWSGCTFSLNRDSAAFTAFFDVPANHKVVECTFNLAEQDSLNKTSGTWSGKIIAAEKELGWMVPQYAASMPTDSVLTNAIGFNTALGRFVRLNGTTTGSKILESTDAPAQGYTTLNNDASMAVVWGTDGPIVDDLTNITAARNRNLSGSNIPVGATFHIIRRGTGAFNYNVCWPAGTAIKVMAVGSWGKFTWTGTAFVETAYGLL